MSRANGEKVVSTAERYLGVVETPPGSNRGPWIDEIQKRWGIIGQPWCGCAADAWYHEAGVDDDGIGHPSVHEMVVRSRKKGRLWDGRGQIPVGAFWMHDWIHTGIVTSHTAGSDTVEIIDGNSANAVRRTIRTLSGLGSTIFIGIPESIRTPDAPVFRDERRLEWYLRDRGAKPFVFRNEAGKAGKWSSKAYADKAIESLLKGRQGDFWRTLSPRSVYAGSVKAWVIQLGDIPLYGPWRTNKDAVLDMKKNIEKRVGRKIELIERPYIVRVRVN